MVKAMLDGELMYPSDYLASEEFKGRDVTLTISDVKIDDLMCIGGKKKRGAVLYFKETKKKFVANKTNTGQIAELYGTEGRKWVGKCITLYPTTCPFGPKIVNCIRVRPTVSKGSSKAQTTHEDNQVEMPDVDPDPDILSK